MLTRLSLDSPPSGHLQLAVQRYGALDDWRRLFRRDGALADIFVADTRPAAQSTDCPHYRPSLLLRLACCVSRFTPLPQINSSAVEISIA